MGKEWLYWGGGSRSTKKRKGDKNSSPPGCMCAVFQLFDNLPLFQFTVTHGHSSFPPAYLPPQLPEEPNIVLKGIEAPRNSLESEGALMKVTSSASSTMKQQHSLNLPMGIQIKTSSANSKPRTNDLSSDCSSSPGTKTPSLVARLMGLDLLPELSSPRPSSSSNPSTTPNLPSKSSSSHHCRSLPETPRISMARRSDSDNYHHRHSLQANKENIFTSEELSKWPDVQRISSYLNAKLDTRREFNRNENDTKKSSLYAKQVVKQVKENIRIRVGTDITNTTMARKKDDRRDEHLVLLKSKKPLTRMGGQEESTLSSSPRLRSLEVKIKPILVPSSATKNQNLASPKFRVVPLKEIESKPQQLDNAKKLKKITSERYDFRSKGSIKTSDVIRNKQEEPFIRSSSTSKVKLSDKKCRKTPLSNNIVNISAPKFLSFKIKDPSPSSTPLLSKNQVSLESSAQYLSRNQSLSHILKAQNNCNADNSNGTIPTTTTTTGDVDYISRLLRHNGIDKTTPISIKQWYSPSHPLHPSIFHHLHHSTTTFASRLMFDLVDELLIEILKPYMNLRPWVTPITHKTQICGRELINILCKKIGSFPAANCRVLEDIDVLIDGDLCMSIKLQRSIAFEEEGEGIVTEIERDIVDTLVHEMAMMMWQGRTI